MPLDKALAWASAGWPVFPCLLDGRPAIKAWQKEATTDEARIREWWSFRPDARVGAVPGRVGCFVIDVDVKGGKDGETSLARLEEEHGFEAWQYPQQETPSGGRHIFMGGTFRTSVERQLGAGLDTRGGSPEGGLGFIYCYADDPPGLDGEIPPAPPSLVALSEKLKERSEDTKTPRVELDQEANVARALAFLKTVKPPAQGERNAAVFQTACTLKDLGLSMAKIFEVMEDHPACTGDPPLCVESPEEFNATVRSAYKNGQLQPGIHAIDESARDAAAAGHDAGAVAESGVEEDEGRRVRPRYTLWADERAKDPPPWLVKGLLPKVSLAGVYGPGGAGKSFIVLDLAMAVASGATEWAGMAISDPGAPVVYIGGEGAVAARLRAWEAKHGRSEAAGQRLALYPSLDIMDQEQQDGFRTDLEALYGQWGRGPGLIVLDTLARSAPGQDENSAKDMGAFVQKADQLRDLANACVLLVHHTPQADSGRWRGSSAVWNALDVALGIKRRSANIVGMRLNRSKDGAEGATWACSLAEIETGAERDGEPEKSLVVDGIAPFAPEATKKIDRAQQLTDARAKMAVSILMATAPGFEISKHALLKQMLLASPEADRAALGKWLGAVVKKGEIVSDHPLSPYVLDKDGPTFQRPS